ncbi:respiratory chain complex I subunit 1 family protein [Thiolapillus sp.]
MNVISLLNELILMPLLGFVVGLALLLMMRRIAAKLQRRVGPPLLQPLYDVIKTFGKETQISHGVIHDWGIILAVGGYIAAETLLPVPGMTGIAEKGGLLVLLYMTMIPSLGMALAASSCANPNASIGVARALTAMLAYEVPYVIVIFGAAYHYGTMSFLEILRIQQEQGMAAWGIAQMPLLAIAGLFAMQGMMGKQPFEIYIAPAEIATGPMVEMGGKYMGSLLIMQSFQYYTTAVLYVTLFLGGGSNWLDFLVKIFAVVAIPTTIAFLFPRYRTEDMVRLMWKWPVIIGLLGLAFMMN